MPASHQSASFCLNASLSRCPTSNQALDISSRNPERTNGCLKSEEIAAKIGDFFHLTRNLCSFFLLFLKY
jgi:hypothetical protein